MNVRESGRPRKRTRRAPKAPKKTALPPKPTQPPLLADAVEAKLRVLTRDPVWLVRARRYAMAYDRWLIGQRRWKPAARHYELDSGEAERVAKTLGLDRRKPPPEAATRG